MSKCGACAMKMVRGDPSMRCFMCQGSYHIQCVGINNDQLKAIPNDKIKTWLCPVCKSKQKKKGGDNTNTPVKNISTEVVDNRILEAVGSGGSLGVSAGETPTEQHSAILKVMASRLLQICDQLQMFTEMQSNIMLIQTELADIKDTLTRSVDDLTGRVSVLETELIRIKDLSERKNTTFEDTINQLKQDINERDQALLINDIEIIGVPEHKAESILHLVSLTARRLGVDLDERDIVYAYRPGVRRERGGDARSRPICVRLSRRYIRDEFLRNARVKRGTTTADIDLPGEPRPIYVNERLTKVNRDLFLKAREVARQKKWKFVWTREGNIFARQAEGSGVHRIATDQNLSSAFGIDNDKN